jgi:hypothetical protein
MTRSSGCFKEIIYTLLARRDSMSFTPFRDGDTHATFRNLIDKIVDEIKSLENEYVVKASPTELEGYYVEKVLIEPLVLHTDE